MLLGFKSRFKIQDFRVCRLGTRFRASRVSFRGVEGSGCRGWGLGLTA